MTELETLTAMITSDTLTAHMNLSEILAQLPNDADWRIVHGELAYVTTCSGRRGRIYWDDQDPQNTGWAYQITGTDQRPEESGELNTVADLANIFAI